MGLILSIVAPLTQEIKERRQRKKEKKAAKDREAQGISHRAPGATDGVQESSPLPQQEQPSLHHQSTLERGLEAEANSSRPPPISRAAVPAEDLPAQERRELEGEQTSKAVGELDGARTGGQPALQREVGLAAPVPLAASTAANLAINEEAKGHKMASDEDYASFLDKANQDPNEGVAQGKSGKIELKAVDSGVEVPKVLQDATKDAWYVSDADEKFTPVVLKFKGSSLPDEATFAKTAGHPSPNDSEVSIMDIGEWDTQGEYKDVVEAVREAGKGSDVRVYRIGRDSTRFEYWVVTLADGNLVGVKALAVES
ncbi:hypothetical protein GLAREA_03638 [Glarea lozoyensis ATCC 20868]|uniref:Uncharacterized protein n=1 Tax=Glarea lozoyensis (strain ATCC 20868 / MF5171) TaxID=1116229 RepID=S3DFB4_GLAL2|nr:uncharacterized protein GLAREA_03638 [Glarea lozoyensis ATCC 20868]EPE30671.1 hypothetical protein GLAREA_03638 [Glarea lozoyensis ATCC 20868]